MSSKLPLVFRLLKNIIVYGGILLAVSFIVDWYRKPNAPAQFAEQVLYDIHRQPKIIAQLSHRQPMILYFWGEWCHYCTYTSPSISKLAEENIPVLSMAIKSGDDQAVADYLTKENYRFPTINDPNADFARSWKVVATPTVLIIKDGKIIGHTTGFTSYLGLKIRLWLSNLS